MTWWRRGAGDRASSDDESYAAARGRMVETQLRARGIRAPGVLAAMAAVPREAFVPVGLRDLAYADEALPIEHGQTISQPFIVALMTELLAPEPGIRVLDVGTGSGYQAAVLAAMGCRVTSVERVPELAATARERLDALGFGDRVEVRVGDGSAAAQRDPGQQNGAAARQSGRAEPSDAGQQGSRAAERQSGRAEPSDSGQQGSRAAERQSGRAEPSDAGQQGIRAAERQSGRAEPSDAGQQGSTAARQSGRAEPSEAGQRSGAVERGTASPQGSAPWPRIVVGAAAPEVPAALLAQLADGGRLVIPVGGRREQDLLLVERDGSDLRTTHHGACVFVPLIGEGGFR